MVHIWTNDQFKCLLDVCIEEVNTVGRRGCSMRKESWDKLGVVLKERFGLSMNQKKMKNAYDGLKAKYVGWTYLKNKTGNLYNEETNTFTLTEEEWEEFRKGYRRAISLNIHPMPFPNLCAALFDGSAATDKYYLCDAAYAHTRGFMAPYRNVRYWLGDFQRRALNSKEKFNHEHAKLRNFIERAFGVLKARFAILKRMTPFSLVTQRNIVVACFALHNFIRKEGLRDEFFSHYDHTNAPLGNENGQLNDVDDEDDEVQGHSSVSDRQYMT